MYHEKTIHEQNLILQSWPDNSTEKVLAAGLHRWPFEFLLTNRMVETIEDEMAKVFYYLSATVHRPGMGVVNLRTRRDILVLRTLTWSDNALTTHALPITSITAERRLDCCDATICIEKSIMSSGTQFPISITLAPNVKGVHLECISVILTEQRVYRLPEYGAKRSEMIDFRLKLSSVASLADPHEICEGLVPASDVPLPQLRRALTAKNAHIPLVANPFQYRFILDLPNCIVLNHTSTFDEIDFRHYLKVRIELTVPNQPERSVIHLETPITILDCRLKEDYATLPTYEEALSDPAIEHEDEDAKPSGFFACPCYLEYKKKRRCGREEWMKIRQRNMVDAVPPPPPYELFDEKAHG